MDPRFNTIFTDPENSVFKVVFYPDRIYHAQYLNATRSPRYRYNVVEVRSEVDITLLKCEVYLDGKFLCNVLRLEYRAGRLVEQVRENNRFLRDLLLADIDVLPEDSGPAVNATVTLHYDEWIAAYQAEIWETLEPPPTGSHDIKVLDMMGRNGSITAAPALRPVLKDLWSFKRVEVSFRENNVDIPFGYAINNPASDNDYTRTHQEPRTQEPSSPQNTIADDKYYLTFQRGWFLQANDVQPVRYRNAMMDGENPERADNNITDMRWIIQRELGGTLVYFHHVTLAPGTFEGVHQHIGSEELYYITEGEGIAYMGDGDDPANDQFKPVDQHIFGLGVKQVRELPVKAGNVIYTKSGGIHGIRNPPGNAQPLKFVAFGYSAS
jgi:oxalate decarboxylase/phosphoglucose isomerase-like protein (cupin superfamily)